MVTCDDTNVGGLPMSTRRRTISGTSCESVTDMEVAVAERGGDAGTSAMPSMSLTDLVMLNAIVCGLEFCASAAFCYIPPMLLKAGIR
jgi:hypothetical protein